MNREWIAACVALSMIGCLAMCFGAGCGKGDQTDNSAEAASAPEESVSQSGAATAMPLSEVLESDLPRVLDFGRGKCIPCKKMAPILNELAREYEGHAVIRIIDIGEAEGRELSKQFSIQLIPTQIFLDGEGNEVWRHEGFLPREDIVAKLSEMGVTPE
jgi:thioredoxin 1